MIGDQPSGSGPPEARGWNRADLTNSDWLTTPDFIVLHTEMREETLKSLETLCEIPIARRRLNYLTKRQLLWR